MQAELYSSASRFSSRERLSMWTDKHLRWILASPAIIFVMAMLVFPVAYNAWLSVTNTSGAVGRFTSLVGIDNYKSLLTDTDRFWPAVGRTVYYTTAGVVIELVLGILIALLLRKTFRGEGIVRTIILIPLVATPVAVGMMWMLIFEPTIGFANEFLSWFGIPGQGWLSNPDQALPTLIFMDVWQWTPMVVLILVAGLKTLPAEIDEAAMVDGASAWQRFWHVTLPMLRPVIISAVLLRTIDALKTFDIIYTTKGKGGGSLHEAETLNIYAYSLSFDYNDYALSGALIVLFLILVVSLAIGLNRLGRKGGN